MKAFVSLLTILLLIGCDNVEEFKSLKMTTIANGNLYGTTTSPITKQCVVITSDSEWQTYLAEMNSVCDVTSYFQNTTIDFSQNEIIVAFDQARPMSSSNAISIDAVESDSKIYIHAKYKETISGTIINAYYQPFLVMSISKTDKSIQINITDT
jgi:hypothetical protein